MFRWLKERTKQEKWMIAIILMLIIGVILRWGFIKKEAGDAFKSRIEHFKPDEKPEPVPEIDSAGWNIVRDSLDI